MVVRMKQEGDLRGTGPPPPPMVYIFEFHDNDQELWLCHPVNTTELPTTFEGPGFERMRRTPKTNQVEEDSSEPLDVRASQYIAEMNKILPLMPQQLPERPSDDEVAEEAQLMEQFTQLRRRGGLKVHQRAVELAKDPSLADSAELKELALGLQKRFVARKIMNMPQLKPEPTKAATEGCKQCAGASCKQCTPSKQNQAAGSVQAKEGCMGGICSVM